MVNLTRIYTRTGDKGTTNLGDLSDTTKTDPRLEAYATVDETNAHLGVALASGDLPADVAEVLLQVQNELFDVGADLCTPVVPDPAYPPLRVEQDYVDRLERWIDHYNEGLEKLRSFILNGGTLASAHLHVARTVCRRPSGRVGGPRGVRRGDEPTRPHLSQPALRPALRARPPRQPRGRHGRRAVEARRGALTGHFCAP